jgi:hypothetical protein
VRTPYLSVHGAWRSLVARLLWEQEVGGSNPPAPIAAEADGIERSAGSAEKNVPARGISARLQTMTWATGSAVSSKRVATFIGGG